MVISGTPGYLRMFLKVSRRGIKLPIQNPMDLVLRHDGDGH